MSEWQEITRGLTFEHEFRNIQVLEITDFLRYFDPLKLTMLVILGENRGVEIGINWHKEWYFMVLCYKCFEEKHDDCMGKQGLFVCECILCKHDSKPINNKMPDSLKYVEKNK